MYTDLELKEIKDYFHSLLFSDAWRVRRTWLDALNLLDRFFSTTFVTPAPVSLLFQTWYQHKVKPGVKWSEYLTKPNTHINSCFLILAGLYLLKLHAENTYNCSHNCTHNTAWLRRERKSAIIATSQVIEIEDKSKTINWT